jgi:hypothetical protein
MEIKSCPHCGGTGKVHSRNGKYYVECNGDCWTTTKKYTDAYLAVEEWNKKATDAEYIDKNAFKERYLACGWIDDMSEEEFDTFPTADVVSVVRCIDCRFRKATHNGEDYYCTVWDADESETAYVCDNDFCSYGERREDDG